jgi:hypothetical protein
MTDVIKIQLAKAIASLDRVCPACLAARTRAEWKFLHRERPCVTRPGVP